MQIELIVVSIISGFVGVIFTFYAGRKISQRIEIEATRRRALEKEIEMIHVMLEQARKTIEIRDKEIQSLKSELEKKEEKIAELQDRVKFAEKVSERDFEQVQARLRKTILQIEKMLKEIEEEG